MIACSSGRLRRRKKNFRRLSELVYVRIKGRIKRAQLIYDVRLAQRRGY